MSSFLKIRERQRFEPPHQKSRENVVFGVFCTRTFFSMGVDSFLKSWNERDFGIGLKNFFEAIAFIFDVPKVTVCKSGPSTGLPMTPISAS